MEQRLELILKNAHFFQLFLTFTQILNAQTLCIRSHDQGCRWCLLRYEMVCQCHLRDLRTVMSHVFMARHTMYAWGKKMLRSFQKKIGPIFVLSHNLNHRQSFSRQLDTKVYSTRIVGSSLETLGCNNDIKLYSAQNVDAQLNFKSMKRSKNPGRYVFQPL